MSRPHQPAAQDHAAVVQRVLIDEIAIGGEACVVPVLDMRAVDFVTAFIGSLTLTAGLDITSRWQKFMADTIVVGNPHACVWMVRLQIDLLCF